METDIPIEILNTKALIKNWKELKKLKKKTEPKKKYDSKIYNRKFYIINKEKVSEKHICPLCKGRYTYFNKSTHDKTQKHLKWLDFNASSEKIDMILI